MVFTEAKRPNRKQKTKAEPQKQKTKIYLKLIPGLTQRASKNKDTAINTRQLERKAN